MPHSHRNPMIRALLDATNKAIAIRMHERTDNEGRMMTMETVLTTAIFSLGDSAVTGRQILDAARQRVRDLVPFARLHDAYAAGKLSHDEWNSALIAAQFPM